MCATSANTPCGHQFCALCIITHWVQKIKSEGRHGRVECPVCRQPLPHIAERIARSWENMPFQRDRRTERLVKSLVDDVTRGVEQYGEQISKFAGDQGRDLADDWKNAMVHRDQFET